MEGFRKLGEQLGGGNTRAEQDVFERRLRERSSLDQMMAKAHREQARNLRLSGLSQSMQQAGIAPEQAGMLGDFAIADVNPYQHMQALGSLQGQGFRQAAVEAASRGDWNAGNAQMLGVASGPQRLAHISGDTLLGNVLTEGGDMRGATDIGEARIGRLGTQSMADMASVEQRLAAASLSRAREADVGRSGGADGEAIENKVYTFFDGDRQISAPSPDGRHYFAPDGTLRPMPPSAVPVDGTRGIEELSRSRVRTSIADEAGQSVPLDPNDMSSPFMQAIDRTTGVIAGRPAQAASWIMGMAGADTPGQGRRDSAAFLNNLGKRLELTMANSGRVPVMEMQRIMRMVPQPNSMNTGAQVASARQLVQEINQMERQMAQDAQTATDQELRTINQSIRELRRIKTMMSEGPVSAQEGPQRGSPGQTIVPRAGGSTSMIGGLGSAVMGEEMGGGLPTVSTDEQFEALPVGAEFIDAETGQRMRKSR